MQRMAVDLPEPEGPQMTMRSPLRTVRETSFSAWKVPYHLLTLRISIIGGGASVCGGIAGGSIGGFLKWLAGSGQLALQSAGAEGQRIADGEIDQPHAGI